MSCLIGLWRLFCFFPPIFDDRHLSAWFCVHLYAILGGQTVYDDANFFMFLENYSSLFGPPKFV